jgi:BR serine/threonine kinase
MAQSIGRYSVSRTLGQGASSKVKLAHHSVTGAAVAIKIIRKSMWQQHPELESKAQGEIALMRLADHPHILRLREVLESRNHLYVILEYAEKGELYDLVLSRRGLPEPLALDYFRQILLAVEYLHNLGIVHRDLKAENILLDACDQAKLADFGYARWVGAGLSTTSCGSPHYAAPEVVRGVAYDGKRSDVWSLGVVLFTMLAGHFPFDDESIRNLIHTIKRGTFQMPAFAADVQDLVRKMLTVDVKQRITIRQIKTHPAFRRGLDPCYVLPSPLPFAPFTEPLNVANIPAEVLEILKQIGFRDRRDLIGQLESRENPIAKVFVALLMGTTDLEQLPWTCAQSGASTIAPIDFSIPIQPADLPGRESEGLIAEHAGLPESPSLGSCSFDAVPLWFDGPILPSQVLATVTIEIRGRPLWAVMTAIQNGLGRLSYLWFHPDPRLICIRSTDATAYYSVSATLQAPMEAALTLIAHKGDPERSAAFFDAVRQWFS